MNAVSTINTEDLNEAVRSTSMLADVTISVWGGERSDDSVTNKIRDDNNATGDVGRFVKKLLAGNDGALKDTKSAFAAVRMKHYGLTLPWVSDPHAARQSGARLLPNMLFDRYMTDMSRARREAHIQLDKFIADYPDLVVKSRTNLGTLADATYPSAEEVRTKFRVVFDFEPIPAGASFRGLPDHMLTKLSKSLADKQNRMISAATAAMWETARERIERLAEKMSDPEARFKLTTVENVRELITLMPGWNIASDPRVDQVTGELFSLLHGVDSDKLRDDAQLRAGTGMRAQRLLEKFTTWGV